MEMPLPYGTLRTITSVYHIKIIIGAIMKTEKCKQKLKKKEEEKKRNKDYIIPPPCYVCYENGLMKFVIL